MADKTIPVLELTLDSYRLLINNAKTYLRLAWIPFIIGGSCGLIVLLIDYQPLRNLFSAFFAIFFPLLLIPVITSWHRLILKGKKKKSRIAYEFKSEEWLYIKATLVLGIAYLAVSFLLGILVGPFIYALFQYVLKDAISLLGISGENISARTTGVLIALLCLFILVRFYLILPSAAIGKPMKVAESSGVTHGNTVRLFSVYTLSYLPITGLKKLVTGEPALIIAGTESGVVSSDSISFLLSLIPEFFFYTVTVAIVSLSYKFFMGTRTEIKTS